MADKLREKDDYVCQQSFCEGAQGKVHFGYLCKTGEPVVIKRGDKRDLQGEYALLKQLAAIGGVGRTHIVRALGYTEYEHTLEYSIIMERAQCSLDVLLDRVPFRFGLPAIDMVQLVADLGIVLKFLLDQNVVHRDIKPQNILVFGGSSAPGKSQFMFKLCDFGMARETEGEGSTCKTIVGTRPYMCPEILFELHEHPEKRKMNNPYTAEKCDLWSIGVTVYAAATAALPWPKVARVNEIRALHENRKGAICAESLRGGGYRYFHTIRADNYPRWLRYALSSLVRAQFSNPSYDNFFAQCAYIAGVGSAAELPAVVRRKQRRVVLLPAFVPTMHVEVDEKILPGAHIPLDKLYSFPLQSLTACLTTDGISLFGPGHHISISGNQEGAVLVWNENSTGLGADAEPLIPKSPPSSQADELLRCVDACHQLDRQCTETIEAHSATTSIAKKNVQTVISRIRNCMQQLQWIEWIESVAASTATMAVVVDSQCKAMLEHLQTCPKEMELRKKELDEYSEAAKKLSECASKWTQLDERRIANWPDNLRRISSPKFTMTTNADTFAVNKRWANEMKNQVEKRLLDLKASCEDRVSENGGIAHVIRNLVKMETTLSACERKNQETASVVKAVAEQAKYRLSTYMQNTVGLDEAQIRKNLTNSTFKQSMVKRNMAANKDRMQELLKQMTELTSSYKLINNGDEEEEKSEHEDRLDRSIEDQSERTIK